MAQQSAQTIVKKKIDEIPDRISDDSVFDKFAADSIPSRTLGAIFNLLVKLSYSLFVAGLLLLNLTNQSARDQFASFVKEEQNRIYLVTLIVLTVIIYVLTELFKKDSKISPTTRKGLNFLTDLLRIATYSLLLFFVDKYRKTAEEDALVKIAFWIFVAAIILFIFRKLVKWIYYYTGKGKENLVPWTNLFVPKSHSLVLSDDERKKIEATILKVIKARKEGQL